MFNRLSHVRTGEEKVGGDVRIWDDLRKRARRNQGKEVLGAARENARIEQRAPGRHGNEIWVLITEKTH